MTKVTYRPQDSGDPHFVEWEGVRLEANKPVSVTNKHILKKAKDNRFFEVEGHDDDEDDDMSLEKPRRGRKSKAEKEANDDPIRKTGTGDIPLAPNLDR